MLRSLFSVLEEVTLLVLPHGGQKTARRNAWKAAASLHVTTSYRWVDPVQITPPRPTAPAAAQPAGDEPVRLARRRGRRGGPRALASVVAARS
ncbi:conserved hypothetical protein [Frankia canadensis]|uniref:Uncharacterized protein n=1 Tax=Frankia canadensis TaxID=1836972 RepID=A0A2I2KTB8_9ACTN|nr:hypothetical protein [Frankia canadensis]SNQ48918.1 conserved hypothetical protein [Frankia canadensis]SOU56208.1 conserved hypothetical protein [Frankia canadensis]